MKDKNKERKLISAYLDGELSPKEKIALEEKIKTSLELQKDLADLKKIKELTLSSKQTLPDSPYFETRLLAEINSKHSKLGKISKWIPALSFGALTVALIVILSFNPEFINKLIEEQKSTIAGFYKENLQPLLFAADLTNEDVFNFALYEELPLDNSDKQYLKLGYDAEGKEYFEIKSSDEKKNSANLKNFIAALNLDEKEQDQIDSIISSYGEKISSQILISNNDNAVAISPNVWDVRKAILADIVSFAKRHAGENFTKVVPVGKIEFNEKDLVWVDEVRSRKSNRYIVFTPDSIFEENFEFDMKKFELDMRKLEKEMAKLEKEKEKEFSFQIWFDSSLSNLNKFADKKKEKNFQVFVDKNNSNVTVRMERIEVPRIVLPNFDSLALVISDATKNLHRIIPNVTNAPQMQVNTRNYHYNYENREQRQGRSVNLDSLIHEQLKSVDSLNEEQSNFFQFFNDSTGFNFRVFTDSIIQFRNEELQREMEGLRQEIEQFRNEIRQQNQEDRNYNSNDTITLEEVIEI